MTIDRKQLIEEMKLREQIRKAIKIVKERKKKSQQFELKEEQTLRKFIRKMILSEKGSVTPEKTTAGNKLYQVLNNILKDLKDGYQTLTTNKDQRDSFRSHILNAIQDIISSERASSEVALQENSVEELKLNVGDLETDDPYIEPESEKEEISPEEERKQKLSLPGFQDNVGRNQAIDITLPRIEDDIRKGYKFLQSNPEDAQKYYDALITNVKLHLDRFEDELQREILPEPTTDDYEREKEKQGEFT